MKVTGTAKDGKEWFIESSGVEPIKVKTCWSCGYPVAVILVNPAPVPQVCRFVFNCGPEDYQGGNSFTIGEVPREAIKHFLREHGENCAFCGALNKYD